MKAIRVLVVAMAIVLCIGSLNACGVPTKGGDALVLTFDVKNALNEKNDFIFKGKINKISEVNISWNAGGDKEDLMVDQWLSVCDVTIENILYGEVPGIQDAIRVVSGQSTRMLDGNEFRLLEGQEYYFITHIFDQNDKTKQNDPIRIYELGDVMAGTFYDLFPVNDGVVSFQGWTFDGENKAGEIASIDEESFLKQFTAMIHNAKEKLVTDSD